MIEPSEIPALVGPFIEAVKRAKGRKFAYSELYDKAVIDVRDIQVHSRGEFPSELIQSRAPSETVEEFEYRKAAYQSLTKSPWSRLCNSVNSVFHNVTLTVDDEDANVYLKLDYPGYPMGFLSWCVDVMGPLKCEQSNAVAVATIKRQPIDDTELPISVIRIYQTADVVMFGRDLFIGISSRTIPVKFGNEIKNEGLEFVIIDENIEYRYTQYGKKLDWTFELSIYYAHNLGELPADQLKNIPEYLGDEILWVSLFDNALPYLNKAAVEASTLDAIITRQGFPTRVYYEEDCDHQGCESGYIKNFDTGLDTKCPACMGTGKKGSFNPFRDYTHKPPGKFEGDTQPTFPGLAFVAPDSAPMEFLQRRLDNLIEKAGSAVNFDLSRDSSQPETATKHRNDKQEQYKTLSKYANQVYDLIERLSRWLIDIRYINNDYTITLTRQSDFEIRSPEELSDEITAARDAGLPQYIISELIRSNALLRMSNDEYIEKLLVLSEYVDPLHGTPADKVSIVASRGFQPWQIALHVQFNALISQLLNEDSNFLDLEIAEQAARIEAKARALQPAANGVQSIIDGL